MAHVCAGHADPALEFHRLEVVKGAVNSGAEGFAIFLHDNSPDERDADETLLFHLTGILSDYKNLE